MTWPAGPLGGRPASIPMVEQGQPSWINAEPSAPSSPRSALSVVGAGAVQTTTFWPLVASVTFVMVRSAPAGLSVLTTVLSGTVSVIGRFSFVWVSPEGQACDVDTFTTS